jgi:hypothetical protein
MVEVTGEICQEFDTDVEIDFSKLTDAEKQRIIQAVQTDGKHTFKKVLVAYEGEATIDFEPDYPGY